MMLYITHLNATFISLCGHSLTWYLSGGVGTLTAIVKHKRYFSPKLF